MHLLNSNLSSPEQELALDESLLELLNEGRIEPLLRYWIPTKTFVVLGYSNVKNSNVNVNQCQSDQIGIYRRCTGGGTVLMSPGCLNYSLVLRIEDGSPWADLCNTNRRIMEQHRLAIEPLIGRPVRICGITDLALDGLKFCGNAQRRRQSALLFHGSFLLKADLYLMEKYLSHPPIAPEYRAGRTHLEFVTNLECEAAEVMSAVSRAWNVSEEFPASNLPGDVMDRLMRTQYSLPSWHENRNQVTHSAIS